MLMSDQIDVFEHDENVAKWTFRNLGLNSKLIKRICVLAGGKHYKAITTSIRHPIKSTANMIVFWQNI
jgi:hypothetical protein